MRYREHPVPPDLAGIVEAIWTLVADPRHDSMPEAIVPDGRAEVVVHFGDAFERWDDGRPYRQAEILVAGQIDRPLWLRPTGRVAVLGIRLAPAGLGAFVPVPASELTNRTPAAADVAPALARALERVRDTVATPDDAVGPVTAALSGLIRAGAIDPRVTRAVGLADTAGASVSAVARAAELTPRQLERLFLRDVGVTPRALIRIRRLQRTLGVLEARAAAGSVRPGVEAAVAGGYADQAHFVREFRALAGRTPSAHLLEGAALTGVFVEPTRRVSRSAAR